MKKTHKPILISSTLVMIPEIYIWFLLAFARRSQVDKDKNEAAH